jgi:hypothetical protein
MIVVANRNKMKVNSSNIVPMLDKWNNCFGKDRMF